jgi:hypothetical protein
MNSSRRDDISKLAYGAIRSYSLPDPKTEKLIDHCLALEVNGVRLGFETSLWHENASLNGYPCHCARCRT